MITEKVRKVSEIFTPPLDDAARVRKENQISGPFPAVRVA